MTALTILVAIGLAPLSVGAAWFTWQLYRADVASDERHPRPRARYSLVVAVTGWIAAGVAVVFACAAGAYVLGLDEVVAALRPASLVGILVLDAIPVLTAGFLRWLQGHDR